MADKRLLGQECTAVKKDIKMSRWQSRRLRRTRLSSGEIADAHATVDEVNHSKAASEKAHQSLLSTLNDMEGLKRQGCWRVEEQGRQHWHGPELTL